MQHPNCLDRVVWLDVLRRDVKPVFEINIHCRVIDEMVSNARQILYNFYAVFFELFRGADSRKHEDLLRRLALVPSIWENQLTCGE